MRLRPDTRKMLTAKRAGGKQKRPGLALSLAQARA